MSVYLFHFTGPVIHPAGSTVQTTFDFDSAGNRARQIKERIAANDSRTLQTTLYLGTYEREQHATRADATATWDYSTSAFSNHSTEYQSFVLRI